MRANRRSTLPGAGGCPGPLRAPPPRADHPVPPGAAARRDLHRRDRGGHRGRSAAERPRTSSTPSSSAESSRTASCACAAPTAATTSGSPSHASGAAFAHRAAPGAWRRRPRTWWTTSFPCAGAPMGAVVTDPAAPAAGRSVAAGDARAAGRAPRDHAPPARAGGSQGRRGRQRRGHADPAELSRLGQRPT